MTLAVQISPEAERRLAEKAKAAGVGLPTFLARLLEAEAERPTLFEISGDAFANFKCMNISDERRKTAAKPDASIARSRRRLMPHPDRPNQPVIVIR
jgi:hypothetical protein